MAVNMLRGAAEPSQLRRRNLLIGIMPPNSKFAGRRYYRIDFAHGSQKGNTVSLRNQSTVNSRNNEAYVPMVEPPFDNPDPLSLFNLIHRHLNEYLPTQFTVEGYPSNDQIFRRQASNKQLQVCFFYFNDNVLELLTFLIIFCIYYCRFGLLRVLDVLGKLDLDLPTSLVRITSTTAWFDWQSFVGMRIPLVALLMARGRLELLPW